MMGVHLLSEARDRRWISVKVVGGLIEKEEHSGGS